MTSPLYPHLEKFVNDEWVRLDRNQITPWVFLTAGPPFRCNDFYGKPIAYQGIAFEGSPRDVFWNRYIEPFIEDVLDRTIKEALALSRDRRQNPTEALYEVGTLLTGLAHRAYVRMSDIDQRLRGRGFPHKVTKKKIDEEFSAMGAFIERRIQAEQAMVRPTYRINEFYNEHPFLFWLIALIVTAALSLLAI